VKFILFYETSTLCHGVTAITDTNIEINPHISRKKAAETASELLFHGADQGIAIDTGLKRAREFSANRKNNLETLPKSSSPQTNND
jgi:hypothetical protein